jgi:hypothetical protein
MFLIIIDKDIVIIQSPTANECPCNTDLGAHIQFKKKEEEEIGAKI